MKTILSGMRPTGRLHLGHLVGALDNWARLQDKYKCHFMVADWHALMSEYEDPSKLKDLTLDIVIDWLSCGIDPKRSTIFVQSSVPLHAELYLILSMVTSLGWLQRCPTYKEQLREIKDKDITTYAFLGYPVLQAADILLYKADGVPVGEDQLPHLEITREITRRFNNTFKNVFPEPEAILTKNPKLLGIDNRKMSKSYDNSIAISDTPEVIRKKVAAMFTDPERIRLSDAGHFERCNVYAYFEVFKKERLSQIRDYCKGAKKGCTECKRDLAEAIVEYLGPIRKRRASLIKNKDEVIEILREGANTARLRAEETSNEVREAVKLWHIR